MLSKRETVFLIGGIIAGSVIVVGTKPIISLLYRVPDLKPVHSVSQFGATGQGRSITIVPYWGHYPGAAALRIRGGVLRDEKDHPIRADQIGSYIDGLCRANPERIVVLLVEPTETMGNILPVASRAREASYGRLVLMYDARP